MWDWFDVCILKSCAYTGLHITCAYVHGMCALTHTQYNTCTHTHMLLIEMQLPTCVHTCIRCTHVGKWFGFYATAGVTISSIRVRVQGSGGANAPDGIYFGGFMLSMTVSPF